MKDCRTCGTFLNVLFARDSVRKSLSFRNVFFNADDSHRVLNR